LGQEENAGVLVVTSWEEALEWHGEGTWEDVHLEGANLIGEAICAKSVERYQNWNAVVELVTPFVEGLVEEKVRETVQRVGLDKAFIDSVLWDIVNLAVEAEYSDLIAPGFFTRLGEWYERGHWPCGWDGPMTGGRLVIY
jgi:hypothetical protein